MDQANNNSFFIAKRARARRFILLRQNRYKRQKMTPTSNICRAPLTEITPSMNNQKTIDQVVREGRELSDILYGSQPCPSYHGFRGPKTFSNVKSMGTNLLAKFNNNVNSENDENTFTCVNSPMVKAKQGRGRPRKGLILACPSPEVGSSSNLNM